MTQDADASPEEAVQPKIFRRTEIRPSALDDDAVKVVSRLRRKGHETFLVGGCVRDLLLHRRPKDFDLATSARPRQVKSLFRNCRIIGRRFKLAHLHFDDKILEVSTFRRRPDQDGGDEDDLLITSDNAFGTANEDAHRRDFTINALFLDPEADCIHDYVSGIEDIERRIVRTIGDPLTRMKEDPVRIVRAIKFAARLSLQIEDATWQAMCDAAADLDRAAPPRILEELQRLMRSGTALKAFQLLRDCGALAVLLPEVSDYLASADRAERTQFWRLLEATDSAVRCSGKPLPVPLVFGALFYRIVEHARIASPEEHGKEADLARLVESVIGPVLRRLSFPRAESGRLKRICVVQRRFAKDAPKRSFRPAVFLRQEYFADALALLRLRCVASDEGWDTYDDWYERGNEGSDSAAPDVATAEKTAKDDATTDVARSDTGDGKGRSRGRSGRDRDHAESPNKKRRRKKSRSDGRSARPAREPEMPPLEVVDLDPSQVPTYGSLLGDTGSDDKIEREAPKGKRARKKEKANAEPYAPPPPPPEAVAPKREEDPNVLGDW